MLVILSQKVDSESSYSDELFNIYHYPAKYSNQLHKGDIFIYYQGNRYKREQRYYFGVGIVGEIWATDSENYYAKLIECQKFGKKVPIYLPDGGYIEQLDFKTIRKSINPPWQSSVRPLSKQAFDYILNAAGMQCIPEQVESIDVLKYQLKNAIKEFYIEGNNSAILKVESIAAAIARTMNISAEEKLSNEYSGQEELYEPSEYSFNRFTRLLNSDKGKK